MDERIVKKGAFKVLCTSITKFNEEQQCLIDIADGKWSFQVGKDKFKAKEDEIIVKVTQDYLVLEVNEFSVHIRQSEINSGIILGLLG